MIEKAQYLKSHGYAFRAEQADISRPGRESRRRSYLNVVGNMMFVKMPSLEDVRSSNAAWNLGYSPVCVVVGGTSGIGQGIAEAIGRHSNGDAYIVLVGRSHSRARKIIDGLPKGSGRTEFVECDLTMVANVKRVSAEILARPDFAGRVNLLVLTAGAISLESQVTGEGLEKSMAVWYYSRWAFINSLLSGLEKAQGKGQEAKVISVLNAGLGKALDANDLGMKKALGSIKGLSDLRETGLEVGTYQDLMVKGFAIRYPFISFVHSRPGPVNTPLYDVSSNSEVRKAGEAVRLATRTVAKSIGECGEHQLYAMLQASPGVSRRGPDGDDIGMASFAGSESDVELLWAHTEAVV
ncbi:hypothetical protein MIND_01318100 [Mycena indigotica]|uniref:NAD(P)-binding protein n=1 Tax=Mycena indigotica TaxID=2126181 RepID=A0A8H6S2R3_9AGAR|nr:uncharacterized protein MIND_01318100 [Mycena indigotica]KAF7290772.1 hypothetical protein MIND_01318100 [Mycena indigotica]